MINLQFLFIVILSLLTTGHLAQASDDLVPGRYRAYESYQWKTQLGRRVLQPIPVALYHQVDRKLELGPNGKTLEEWTCFNEDCTEGKKEYVFDIKIDLSWAKRNIPYCAKHNYWDGHQNIPITEVSSSVVLYSPYSDGVMYKTLSCIQTFSGTTSCDAAKNAVKRTPLQNLKCEGFELTFFKRN